MKKIIFLIVFTLTIGMSTCFGANLTLNEFREICNIPSSVEIPSALQTIITTDSPVIIKSQDGSSIHIYPISSTVSYINGYLSNVGWQGNFSFFSTGSSPNTYFYFAPNFTFTSNPSRTWSKACYVYNISTQTFSTQTWINMTKGYGFSNDQVGARFGLKIDANNQTDTQFKSLATLKAFLMDNLLFSGVNTLVYGGQNVLYRFNGVYAGDDVYTSKFTTNLNNFRFTYEAYSNNENYSVVNYYYLQKFAPNEAIQLTNQDIAYWAGENWFYDRDRTEDFSFNTLIDKMEPGYIYRLRAFSNQHNASGDLIRTTDATSQFFSLNSWKSSEIEVLNIYELLFTDNPSIEDTGGGTSGGGNSGGIIDITGIENQIGNLNTSINDLNNNIEDTILGTKNESGEREGGLVGNLLDGLWKGLVSLIIPSSEDFGKWITDMYDDVNNRGGILLYGREFWISLLNLINNEDVEDLIFVIPEIRLPVFDVVLYEGTEFNLNQFIESHEGFKEFYTKYIIIVSGLSIYMFCQYLWSLWNSIINGTGTIEVSQDQELDGWSVGQYGNTKMPHYKTKRNIKFK